MEAEDSAAADLRAHGDAMKNWIENYISQDEIKKIEAVVLEAEKHTEGEIVPIIVKSSSAVGHVKWILTALMTIIFIICETFYIRNQWDPVNSWAPPVAFLLFYVVSIYLAKMHWFQRVFTPNEDEINQVNVRAELEFYRAQMNKTAKKTGILIFVSLMERRVVVLADKGIAEHYPQATWDEVVKLITDEFKQKHVFAGLEKAIKRCGEILQAKLPAAQHNVNELANHLIIKR